ncbi:MAG TPA: YetF domain-containing protein [Anaerolineaceae bacterium]
MGQEPDLPLLLLLASVAVRSALIMLFLIFGIRIFGKREVGDMDLLDVALVLLLGNAVQNALTYGSGRFWIGLVAAGTLLGLDRGLDVLFARKPELQRRLFGAPTVIATDGQMDRRAMRKEGVDEDELYAAMREFGLTELEQVHLAVLEDDGDISIIPKDRQG